MFRVTNAIYVVLPIKKASMLVSKERAQLILRAYGLYFWCGWDLTQTFARVHVHIGSPYFICSLGAACGFDPGIVTARLDPMTLALCRPRPALSDVRWVCTVACDSQRKRLIAMSVISSPFRVATGMPRMMEELVIEEM